MVTSRMNTAQELLTGPLPQKGYQQDALFAGDKVPPFPFFIENPADLHRTDLPTNSSRESHGDQELSRVNNVRPETSPNPLPNRCQFDHPTRMVVPSEQRERGTSPELRGDNGFIDTNPLPERCQFTFSDGRQCRMARSEIHPSRCPFHAEREDQLFGDPSPGGNVVGAALDLPELYSACRDLTTAAGVNRALAQVFRLLAQRRISRQEAATFGHLAQLLLRSISAMRALAGESHGHQELSPDNKVAAGDRAQPDSRVTPQREANAAPASCAQADDATSIVIPNDGPERGISPAPPVNIVTPLLAHNKVALSPLSSSRESPAANGYPQDELRGVEKDHQELSRVNEVHAAPPPNSQLSQNEHIRGQQYS